MTAKNYDELLKVFQEKEEFPTLFIHKFIGRNTPEFLSGVAAWAAAKVSLYPTLRESHRRFSGDQKHCSLTFEFTAQTAEEVIDVLKSTTAIPDFKMVL